MGSVFRLATLSCKGRSLFGITCSLETQLWQKKKGLFARSRVRNPVSKG